MAIHSVLLMPASHPAMITTNDATRWTLALGSDLNKLCHPLMAQRTLFNLPLKKPLSTCMEKHFKVI
jgi:hypothetical protein